MGKTFEELYRIDVSKNVEKKMGLSYLSWAWAWAEMKKVDENAHVEVHEFPQYIVVGDTVQTIYKPYLKDEGGAWVKVSVTLNNRTESEFLPVMDMRNKAVATPDATLINKNIKRCFVKALALHGLGLFLFAGEDLPEVEPPKPATKQQRDMLQKLIEDVAEHSGKSYEATEKIAMKKVNVSGRYDDITNEDYGLILNYVKELVDYYEKNPDKSKKKEEPEALDPKEAIDMVAKEMKQEGMKLEYPEAKK